MIGVLFASTATTPIAPPNVVVRFLIAPPFPPTEGRCFLGYTDRPELNRLGRLPEKSAHFRQIYRSFTCCGLATRGDFLLVEFHA